MRGKEGEWKRGKEIGRDGGERRREGDREGRTQVGMKGEKETGRDGGTNLRPACWSS